VPLNDAVDELVTNSPPLVAPPTVAGDEPEPEPENAAPGSVLAALRARAKQLREEQTVVLDVPGYDGYLAARYKAVSLGRLFAKRTDATTPINPDWGMAADTLATALVELLMRDAPDGDLYPLFTDQPARYDDDTVEALGLEVHERSARAVIVALCGGGALGESRVWAHYMAYQGWLMAGGDGDSAEEEAAREAVGEYRRH
jgi:hypothetical protein